MEQAGNKAQSLYRKAMYAGVKMAMDEYVGLVLRVEQVFLMERHFTFANLKAELMPF